MDLIETVNRDLATSAISPKSLTSGCRFPFRNTDFEPSQLLFFYHLGKSLKPTCLLEIGFDLGLYSRSFLTSCKTVKKLLAFNETQEEYSTRMGKHNIRDKYQGEMKTYVGSIDDQELIDLVSKRQWELVLINDEVDRESLLKRLNLGWSHLTPYGCMILKNTHYNKIRQAFIDFCKIMNRPVQYFNNQEKSGIIFR